MNEYLEKINKCEKCEKNLLECDGIFKNKSRIVAIGDLHGDFEVLFYSLYKSNCINKDGNWIGKDTHVVQLGDILDRGRVDNNKKSKDVTENEELYIIQFLEKLDKEAQLQNGRVLFVVGNHELMNLISNFSYTTKNSVKFFGGLENRARLFQPGGKLAIKLSCLSFGIIKINDWIFVHAGLLPEHLKDNKSLDENFKEINKLVKDVFNGNKNLDNLNVQEKNILLSNEGIFWTREFSNNNYDCNKLNFETNKLSFTPFKLNKGGIIVGHTPQGNGIKSKCNNRLWFVDNAMSKAFDIFYYEKKSPYDRIEVLEITYPNNKEYLNII